MKIEQLVLETGSLTALAEFYEKLLELPVKRNNDSVVITIGDSLLTFSQTKHAVNPSYHFAFNIPSNKIGEAKLWLAGKTTLLWIEDYKSDMADFKSWHAQSVYFYDAAGNIVELIARADLNDVATETFSASQIRNISEVGIVFSAEQFNENIQTLMEQYPFRYFDKQPPLAQFRAIGNDEGLLICVPESRAWFPTVDHYSAICPMTIFGREGMQHFELNL